MHFISKLVVVNKVSKDIFYTICEEWKSLKLCPLSNPPPRRAPLYGNCPMILMHHL